MIRYHVITALAASCIAVAGSHVNQTCAQQTWDDGACIVRPGCDVSACDSAGRNTWCDTESCPMLEYGDFKGCRNDARGCLFRGWSVLGEHCTVKRLHCYLSWQKHKKLLHSQCSPACTSHYGYYATSWRPFPVQAPCPHPAGFAPFDVETPGVTPGLTPGVTPGFDLAPVPPDAPPVFLDDGYATSTTPRPSRLRTSGR